MHRRPLHPRLRHGLRAVAFASLTFVLAACAPSTLTAEFEADGDMSVAAEPRGALLIVRVPDERPQGGIDVSRDRGRDFHVPPGHYPPPGQCRIWRPERPPGQQSPPGSCDELERQVPEGAYLIYG